MAFTVRSIHLILFAILVAYSLSATAHHVLGRPSYSLNEDSNTPPSKQFETRIGKYYVTYMAFPAFPKPNEQGRVNVYIKRVSDGLPFDGKVTFTVKDDGWFASKAEKIGVQSSDDNVYRQGFVFKQAGNYIISAKFHAQNEPYVIDFPLTIGSPGLFRSTGALVLSVFVGAIILVLLVMNLLIKKRLLRLQTSRNVVPGNTGLKQS